MSNSKTPPARRPSGAARRAAAPQRGGRTGSSDRFGFYFIAYATLGVLLFGFIVYGVRQMNANNAAAPLPAATATPTALAQLPVPPVDDTPLPMSPVASPTSPAPDALQNGSAAPRAVITAVVVTDTAQIRQPEKLPPQIPQAHMDLSASTVAFDAVSAGGVVTQSVTLANSGGADLVLLQLASDCPCLTAQADASKLRPGTRTQLTLRYDPAQDPSDPGAAQHALYLATTDGQKPAQEIVVTATKP